MVHFVGKLEEMKHKAQAATVEVGTQEAENEGPFKTQITTHSGQSAEAPLSQGNSNTHLPPTAASEALLAGKTHQSVTHL